MFLIILPTDISSLLHSKKNKSLEVHIPKIAFLIYYHVTELHLSSPKIRKDFITILKKLQHD